VSGIDNPPSRRAPIEVPSTSQSEWRFQVKASVRLKDASQLLREEIIARDVLDNVLAKEEGS
jgi:hypothetical protein